MGKFLNQTNINTIVTVMFGGVYSWLLSWLNDMDSLPTPCLYLFACISLLVLVSILYWLWQRRKTPVATANSSGVKKNCLCLQRHGKTQIPTSWY